MLGFKCSKWAGAIRPEFLARPESKGLTGRLQVYT